MLIEIYQIIIGLAFLFTILSFIPLGEKRRVTKRDQISEYKNETQSFVALFPWIAMGLFFILSITSMDITVLECELETIQAYDTDLGASVCSQNFTNVWNCNEYQHVDTGLAYLFSGLGVLMFVYAVVSTFLWSTGTLIEEVKNLQSNS